MLSEYLIITTPTPLQLLSRPPAPGPQHIRMVRLPPPLLPLLLPPSWLPSSLPSTRGLVPYDYAADSE
jgi:hypothetical protein